MSYKNAKKGWFRLTKPEKFLEPIDTLMESYKNGYVHYKSSLELHAIKYCDFNPHVKKWSLEPFPIRYLKPTDNQFHRYYVDLVIEFRTGEKFLVEVKSSSETVPPKKPQKQTPKAFQRYTRETETYLINQAKWAAAREFADLNGFKFIILTEKQLK